MYKYKIIASDLDGTLLNDSSDISKENLSAIDSLKEKGVFFVPATGRGLSELSDKLKNNDSINYYILSNGAVVYDKKGGNHIKNCIDKASASAFYDLLCEYDVHITLRRDGKIFIDADTMKENDHIYYRFSDAHTGVIKNYAIPVSGFADMIHSSDDIELFSMHFADSGAYRECADRAEQIEGLTVVRFPSHGMEVFSRDAGKGRALCMLADRLGIKRDDTIAVGDSMNDLSMIDAAGLGLCVSGGAEGLKAASDRVICKNSEHIAEYINKALF